MDCGEICVETGLTRLERAVMDVVYKHGRASGREILHDLNKVGSYSTVRAILATLERKGVVRHTREGLRYVYEPAISRRCAAECALERVVKTFFAGSALRRYLKVTHGYFSKMTRPPDA